MKLYYSPGACSLSPHIALEESGLPYEAIKTSTKTHQLDDGTDYYTINPLGYVPFLVLDDGSTLRENPPIVCYIADQAPDKKLAPPSGTMARYRLHEWLTFIGTEIHKRYSPLFSAATPDAYKATLKQQLLGRYQWLDAQLAGKQYLMGEQFTVADGYLFTVTNWAKPMSLDLTPFTNLLAFQKRVAERPAVQAAMKAEGLIK